MKRIISVILVLAVFLSGSVTLAIEKKDQKRDSVKITKQEMKTPDIKSPNKKADEKPKVKKDTKDYDNFVDKNKNGIDDRAEKKSQKKKENTPDKTGK